MLDYIFDILQRQAWWNRIVVFLHCDKKWINTYTDIFNNTAEEDLRTHMDFVNVDLVLGLV